MADQPRKNVDHRDAGQFDVFMQIKQLFSEQAGNLDLMSGAAEQQTSDLPVIVEKPKE